MMFFAEDTCKQLAPLLERLLPLMTDANADAMRGCHVFLKADELREELLKFEAAVIEQSVAAEEAMAAEFEALPCDA